MDIKTLSYRTALCASIALGAAFQTAQAAPDLAAQFPVKGGAMGAQGTAKKRGAAQKSVALKGAFPTVARAQIKGALDAKNLAVAAKSVGKVTTFTGVVAEVYAPKHGKFVLINLAKDYKTALIGSVQAADFRDFPDLTSLKGKPVALTGKVMLFKGAPEIELTQKGAIRIVK